MGVFRQRNLVDMHLLEIQTLAYLMITDHRKMTIYLEHYVHQLLYKQNW